MPYITPTPEQLSAIRAILKKESIEEAARTSGIMKNSYGRLIAPAPEQGERRKVFTPDTHYNTTYVPEVSSLNNRYVATTQYPEWLFQDLHRPSIIFSNSLDEELAPGILGVTPFSRTYVKINMDPWYQGLNISYTIRHELDHVNDQEYLLLPSIQEVNVRYRQVGQTGDWSQAVPEPQHSPFF